MEITASSWPLTPSPLPLRFAQGRGEASAAMSVGRLGPVLVDRIAAGAVVERPVGM